MSQSDVDQTPPKNRNFAYTSVSIHEADHDTEQQNAESLPRNSRNLRSRRWWQRVGWPAGALGAGIMAAAVLLVNLIVLIWTLRTFNFDHGVAQIFAGSCDEAETIDTWVHLAINALSTILLSSSNYCMQIVSAPTRQEVDKAHARKKWLDVGVPSLRNIRDVAVKKRLMWWLLGLSSVPLHLMYNSVVFSTIATNEYDIVYAQEAFVQGGHHASYNETEFGGIRDIQAHAKSWDRLEKIDCINAYATAFLNTRRDLVVVILDKNMTENDSVKQVVPYELGRIARDTANNFDYYGWICNTTDGRSRYGFTEAEASLYYRCSAKVSKVKAHAEHWNSGGYDIDYCLSEPVQGKCSLNFSLYIVAVVMVCNFGKALSMFSIAFRIRDRPLITVGDAIDSFLNLVDPTTRGMCLVSKQSIKDSMSVQNDRGTIYDYENPYARKKWERVSSAWKASSVAYKARFKRWSSSASGSRWWSCIVLLFSCMLTVGCLLAWGLTTSSIKVPANRLKDVGFGAVHPWTVIRGMRLASVGGTTLIASVLVANVPQIILSFLYLLFNGIFTTMLLADEWSHFAHERKGLRVSDPKPGQRSTYFLQLPYRYALPLMILSGVLHWSVSQSLFLVQVATVDREGELAQPAAISTCGYSPVAIMLTMALLSCLATVAAALGVRRYKPGIPLAGSCSAVIAAACHPKSDVDTTAPLQWGVTSEEGPDVGHCAFSDGPVDKPREGALYAGLRKRDRQQKYCLDIKPTSETF